MNILLESKNNYVNEMDHMLDVSFVSNSTPHAASSINDLICVCMTNERYSIITQVVTFLTVHCDIDLRCAKSTCVYLAGAAWRLRPYEARHCHIWHVSARLSHQVS